MSRTRRHTAQEKEFRKSLSVACHTPELREKWSIFDHTFEKRCLQFTTTFLDFRGKKPASGRVFDHPNGKGCMFFARSLLG